MLRISRLFDLTPMDRPGDSAAAYVPLVMVSRGLSFLRTLLVARILGKAGQEAFGLYQPAIEFINPLVALVLCGAADVSERYFSRVEQEQGRAAAKWWSGKVALRVLLVGVALSVALLVPWRWVSGRVWGVSEFTLLALCASTMIALALYQHLAATLRGSRAYAAASGMELISALLLLAGSLSVAPFHSANLLMAAYCVAVLLPALLYGVLFWRAGPHQHPQQTIASMEPVPSTEKLELVLHYAPPAKAPPWRWFAIWAVIRLSFVMLFGFLSLWGVRLLGDSGMGAFISGFGNRGLHMAADYAVPFRISQLVAFLALTLWSSVYGISTRVWSQGRRRQARLQFSRVGRLGFLGLLVSAAIIVGCRNLIAMLMPIYAPAIRDLLPGMTAMFLWYAMAAYCSSYTDLCGRPYRGAAIWAAVVVVQAAAIAYAYRYLVWEEAFGDPRGFVMASSMAGLCLAIAFVGPWAMGCSPRVAHIVLPWNWIKMSVAIFLAPLTLLIHPVVLAAYLLLMLISGQLIRPYDRRAIRRWLKKRFLRHA
jgi:hypothetical protein